MKFISLSLLCLLWSLVEVQSQTEYPYISFMGNPLPNHSYVNLSQVGENGSGNDSDTVQCHTDLKTCCHDAQGMRSGDWFAPGSDSRLPFQSEGTNIIYQSHQSQVVHLGRRNNATGPSGIYRCVIPTNAVNDDSNGSVGETVYVGLYGSGGGDITISDGMTFAVDSDLNGASPQFTLTCISTGGPATTVTWTRDSVTVTEGNKTVLDNRVTLQYTHTLTVTGRLGGLYTCTVANNKPSEKMTDFTVKVASAPTNLMAVQEGPTSIRVSWSPPTPLGDTTGYRIYYSGGSSDSVYVSDGSTDNYLLTGLQNGETYTISINGTSEHFLSERTRPVEVTLKSDSSNSQSGNNVGAVAGGVIVAVVFIITTAVTVIVIVFLVLRRNHRGNYSISAGAQKDPDVIHTSGNEAYLAVKKTGENDIDEDYEIPMPPSLFPSLQPASGDYLYEPV